MPTQQNAVTTDYWSSSFVCYGFITCLLPCPFQISVVTHVVAAPRESAEMTIPPAIASIKTRVLPLQVYFTPGMALRMLVSSSTCFNLSYNTGIDYCVHSSRSMYVSPKCNTAFLFCSSWLSLSAVYIRTYIFMDIVLPQAMSCCMQHLSVWWLMFCLLLVTLCPSL